MLGYSDSHRDGGIAAARWSLQKAQQALVATMARHGVALTVFHGRGGTMSRSGGAQHEAVLAAPRGAIAGRLRMTEQGENINTKYGLRGIALRTFEQLLSAVLLVTVRPPPENPAEARWQSIMEEIAVASRGAYQSLLSDPDDFMEYFRAATPIDVIERIGSRSERAEHVSESVTEPRAAPWVFAWTQSRCLLPSWYGVATGLKKAIDVHGEEVLVEMFEQWHFFRVLLSDVATALAKADLDVAARYSLLAGERHEKFFPAIRREYRSCVDLVLRLTRQNELLEASRTLRRAIRLRNPYVDPMSFLQVDLLERWRAGGRQDGADPAGADGEHQRHRARDAGHGLTRLLTRRAAPQRRRLDPANDASLELVAGDVALGQRAAAHRNAGAMDRLRVAGDERVPPVERLARPRACDTRRSSAASRTRARRTRAQRSRGRAS